MGDSAKTSGLAVLAEMAPVSLVCPGHSQPETSHDFTLLNDICWTFLVDIYAHQKVSKRTSELFGYTKGLSSELFAHPGWVR